MKKENQTMASNIKTGGKIEFDNKEFVPMLDIDGNQRIGSRGGLVKYGYVKRNATVLTTREDKIQVRVEGKRYDQWLKHNELINLTVH